MDNKRVVMKGKEFEKGITLVTLIITIIVLIILAAVSIIAVAKTNFIEVALNSSVNYAKKQNEEMNEMDYVEELTGNTVEKINGYGVTLEGEKTPSIPEDGCVGYYADFEGDGIVDGIIYADLLVGGNDIPKITNTKDYYISQTNYEGTFGKRDVISPLGSGEDRFYVMALKDIVGKENNSPYFMWYKAAYNEIIDYYTVTSRDFGTGKQNTNTMISKWNNEEYGIQDKGVTLKDIWGEIQNEVKEGWFVPSAAEWSVCVTKLEINGTNYSEYGFSGSACWSSSLSDRGNAYLIMFSRRYDRAIFTG